MKDSASLRFLYHTVPGRAVLKLLVNPAISKAAGAFLDSSASKFIVNPFIKNNGISLDGIKVPKDGFSSFNDFFTREKDVIEFDSDSDAFCAPCDGFLTAFAIDSESRFLIKNSLYSLADLLKDENLASHYAGGTALIFRLTPNHYHRYHFPDNAEIIGTKKIPGVLHTVRPIAAEQYPIYIQNSRELTVYKTENFGTLVQMEVGALLVGRICNKTVSGNVSRGDLKGFFEFGGSTVVLLVQHGKVKLNEEITSAFDEIPVKVGEKIGIKIKDRITAHTV